MKQVLYVAALIILGGCATSTVTPVSKNSFILNTSAAPHCGTAGAQGVASKMAAVETLRRGYEHYLIVSANAANNTSVVNLPPTNAYTTGTFNTYGNTTYGTATTTYYGGGPIVTGSHDAQLAVVMLKPGDKNFNKALNAKSELGSEWQKLVEKGVTTCT